MKNELIIIFIGLLLCSACKNSSETQKISQHRYYNIDSLLDAQIKFLTDTKAQLIKKADSQEVVVLMDNAEWGKALSVFRYLDINKLSSSDTYVINKNIADSTSNLTILQYQLKHEESNSHLKELNIYYLGSLEKVKKISARSSTNSLIYTSENTLELFFDQEQDRTNLKSYNISLQQKTMLRDSVCSFISFEII